MEPMLNRWIILLRGVMPTGKNKVPMQKLREAVSAAGYRNVKTYIQSGNLLLESDRDRQAIAEDVHNLILEKIGPDLAVIIRSPEEIQKALDESPFTEGFFKERVFYTFPQSQAEGEALAALAKRDFGEDLLRIGSHVIYLYIPGSAARTPLSNKALERALGRPCTTRNRNTLERLMEMSNG